MAVRPPTRNLELIISELIVPGPCCFCGAKDGVMRCSQCKAVQYCGEDCQNRGWDDHKTTCHEVSQKVEETTAAIDALANRHGGTAALLEAPLVKRGLFFAPDDVYENHLWPDDVYENEAEPYIEVRWSLAKAYVKCGEETSSSLAFRLAAENFLDLLRLTRNNHFPSLCYLKGCTWMVAGDMDQLALNLLCYYGRYKQAPHPFPYSDMPIDEDIEGVSCITAVQGHLSQFGDFHDDFQTFLLLSLIKFKRLQAILIQSRKEDARWSAFMEGTHPETGESAAVLRLAGVNLVTEKLKEFVVDQSTIKRVALLAKQINGLLKSVNERNPKLIPAIIDKQTLVVHPGWDYEFELAIIYGHAWHMDREYAGALRLFLDTANVMAGEEDTGHEKAEENTDHEKAEEITGNMMAVEKDTGHVKAEEDTDNMMAVEEDNGNVMSVEKDAGHVKAEEDTSQ